MVPPRWRITWKVLEKLKLGLPYDPAVLLLGTCLERTIIQEDVCTQVFIVKPWKQTIYSSTDKEDVVHTYGNNAQPRWLRQ